MSNHLGSYFKARRHQKGLGLGQVARLLGYRNLSKGANKVQWFEQNGTIQKNLLVKLMEILEIEPETVHELVDRDRDEYVREWTEWVNEPVPIQIVVRCLPGVMGTAKLPPEVTTPEQAVTYGQDLASRIHKKVFVVLSRRETVGIDEQGEINGRFQATPDFDPCPSMHLGRARFLFHFGSSGPLEKPYQ